jgi:hypothetical protein
MIFHKRMSRTREENEESIVSWNGTGFLPTLADSAVETAIQGSVHKHMQRRKTMGNAVQSGQKSTD